MERFLTRWRATVVIGSFAWLSGILLVYVIGPFLHGHRVFDPGMAGTAAEYLTAGITAVGLLGVFAQVQHQRRETSARLERQTKAIHLTFQTEQWLRDATHAGVAVSVFARNVGDEQVYDYGVKILNKENCPAERDRLIHNVTLYALAPAAPRSHVATIHVPDQDRDNWMIEGSAPVRVEPIWDGPKPLLSGRERRIKRRHSGGAG